MEILTNDFLTKAVLTNAVLTNGFLTNGKTPYSLINEISYINGIQTQTLFTLSFRSNLLVF